MDGSCAQDEDFKYPNEIPEDDPEPEHIEEIYDQCQEEANENLVFQAITGHNVKDGVLQLTATYVGSTGNEEYIIPFSVLKKDVPV